MALPRYDHGESTTADVCIYSTIIPPITADASIAPPAIAMFEMPRGKALGRAAPLEEEAEADEPAALELAAEGMVTPVGVDPGGYQLDPWSWTMSGKNGMA
jgi:hypothetical protein